MLTKGETLLIDRYLTIHERYVDEPIFYCALANIVPISRAEQLFESDAYNQYIEDLFNDYINI
jgi:hypothetical protein